MKEPDRLALHGGPKVKTTPYGTGEKHDADVEAEALRARLNAGPLPLAKGPSVMELRRFDIASCPRATDMASRSVRVHLNEFVTDQDVRHTVLAVQKVARWYRRGGAG